MPRYVNEFSMVNDANGLYAAVEQYLRSEGYEYTQYDGEDVFKKGKGLATGPTFFRYFVNNGNIRLEAWLKFAILPGVYAGEMDLDGAMGFAMKAVLKTRVQQVESIIMQFGGRPVSATYAQQQAYVQQPQQQPQQQAYAQQQAYVQQPQQQDCQRQPQAPAFCGQCGAKLADGAAFCQNCGSAVK